MAKLTKHPVIAETTELYAWMEEQIGQLLEGCTAEELLQIIAACNQRIQTECCWWVEYRACKLLKDHCEGGLRWFSRDPGVSRYHHGYQQLVREAYERVETRRKRTTQSSSSQVSLF